MAETPLTLEPQPPIDRVAFVTYETPYTPCGGVAAVMKHLPAATQRAAGKPTIVISPFHHRMRQLSKILPQVERLGNLGVTYLGEVVELQILRYLDDWSWYFLAAEDSRFFAGASHPYDVSDEGIGTGATLKRDALLFGIGVAKALRMLAPGQRYAVMMQDWEAATAAIALHDDPLEHSLRLTLHNSYDCELTDGDLWDFGLHLPTAGPTVLQRVAPLVTPPITTVSRQFATDMTEDTLQCVVTAPHLQGTFHTVGLVGVDNGPFVQQMVPQDLCQQAAAGHWEGLHQWKLQRRVAFVEALQQVGQALQDQQPLPWGTPDRPWGEIPAFLDGFDPHDETPWYVMGGRDDPRQKGYDLASRAVQRFLQDGGDGRFLFFPIPGDEGLLGLSFLRGLAQDEQFNRRVIVFPVRFRDGFLAALQGSTYGLMPSLYEPFGAANEFYLNGTVGIGRATGGIVQQIVPVRDTRAFSEAVRWRVDRWHSAEASPTGFLFREPDGLPSQTDDWQAINAGRYNLEGGQPDRVEQRRHLRVYEEMADQLRLSLFDAADLFRQHRQRYYKMLADGVEHIRQNFNWDRSGQGYLEAYLP